MDFESPDVEREFPGLYASDAGKKSNDSDFSDETHEKVSKKDLLIGKRKDKKDKKDRGYATLEGESSPDEEPDVKSPSKTKKSKPFKFPSTKKEKREKSREKESKDKESDKDKKKEEKEKKKEKEKVKVKSKDKKKKHSDDSSEPPGDLPIFGVPLSVAVERSKCHDGVDIPLVVRNCIDHVQETGLTAENVYKVSGIKSRVQQVRKMYNNHEPVNLKDYDLPVATSLMKQYLRELPEPVVTTELTSQFEEAGGLEEAVERGEKMQELLALLPSCNRALLGWLLKHFDNIALHEKVNKMNAQAISVTMSPLLQISQRLLLALLCHVSQLYPTLVLTKYVPPLPATSPTLPESVEGLMEELGKQESLLGQIHREMYQGLAGKEREEQLWAVSRIITQIKRKLRMLEKNFGGRSLDDTDSSLRLDEESQRSVSKEDCRKGSDSPWTPQGDPPSLSQPVSGSSRKLSTESERRVVVCSTDESKEGGRGTWSTSLDDMRRKEETGGGGRGQAGEEVWTRLDSSSPRQLSLDLSLASSGPSSGRPLGPHTASHGIPRSADGKRRGSISRLSDPPSPLPLAHIRHTKVTTAESLEVQDINRQAVERAERTELAILETEELTEAIAALRSELRREAAQVNTIRSTIHSLGGIPHSHLWCSLSESSEEECDETEGSCPEELKKKKKKELKEETKRLQAQKKSLIENINAERDACINLRVQIKFLQQSRGIN